MRIPGRFPACQGPIVTIVIFPRDNRGPVG